MKVIYVMLSALCAKLGIFLATSLYSGITPQPQKYQKPAIVFDLGGVTFKTNRTAFAKKNLGMIKAGMCRMINGNIKKRWYETLEQVAEEQNNSFSYCDPDGKPISLKDQDGKQLPLYLTEWLTSNRSNEDLCTEICTCIEEHPEWFGPCEQDIMLGMTRGTFVPEQFVLVQQLIVPMIKLMEQLKHEGYPIYILSNWDKESFVLMIQMYPELNALCNGYMASGQCQMAKPDSRINRYFEQQFAHTNYVLIDDQEDNIAAAKICGWYGIKVNTNNPSIKKIRRKIAQFDQMIYDQYTGQVAA